MPNIKFGIGDKSGVKKESSGIYNGPTPPKGIYKVLVRKLTMKINRNGDPMLNCLVEIREPNGRKNAKYNGYGFWWNGNVTDEGSGYINQFLDALSGEREAVRKAFWNGKIRCNALPKKGSPATVMAIGQMKIQQEGMPAVVAAFRGKPFNDEVSLKVGDWLLPHQGEALDDSGEAQDADDVDEGDDVDVEVEDADVDVDDDGDDGDDDDGDDDDDDDDAVSNLDSEPSEDDDDDEPPF